MLNIKIVNKNRKQIHPFIKTYSRAILERNLEILKNPILSNQRQISLHIQSIMNYIFYAKLELFIESSFNLKIHKLLENKFSVESKIKESL